jgi:hypothetical protein
VVLSVAFTAASSHLHVLHHRHHLHGHA